MDGAPQAEQVKCPHCGFRNFAISAYCGRCERPLRQGESKPTPEPLLGPEVAAKTDAHRIMTGPVPVVTAPASPPPLTRTVTPINGVKPRPSTPPAGTPARAATRPVTPPGGTSPGGALPLMRPPLAAVPPPEPPPLAPVEPSPLPIALPPKAAKRAAKRAKTAPRKPVSAESLSGYDLMLPGAPRTLIALGVDAALVLGVTALLAFVEATLFSDGALPRGGFVDAIAAWLSANAPAVQHMGAAGLVLALAYVTAGAYYGQTVGRRLAGLIVFRKNGSPMSWPVAIVRTLLATLSVLTFGFGFFYAIADRHARSLHDMLAGTVVVRRRAQR